MTNFKANLIKIKNLSYKTTASFHSQIEIDQHFTTTAIKDTKEMVEQRKRHRRKAHERHTVNTKTQITKKQQSRK